MADERPERPIRTDRPSRPERPSRPGGRPDRRPYHKKKVCRFCKTKGLTIDYKDAKALRGYVTEKGRIVPRRISGTCAKHQRVVCSAIKRARNLAILPFTTTSI
ncbi:MAG TPA: 30S ribosomal protein S18 [Deltaproteobacteria bacterium]|nr:MAG: 30S ribosomal protein S18 [Deltaproteobacteria bacterium GWA2_55_82]OGQ62278.1 MAG: 30S ribosomal protein S18 [Deltaproteobacteria bacterium RIFCSPLOWO2_02_FULL_55_12]OIJ74390.1 MAG: 30S ribosomal protein S18 [Deltaproteobacteria bacterium GWC2_55_46]HBG47039.1 30S ribosomal protein S18 [Deltaproteobacteria bacterium]HCY10901.1 30S ribosomal protein S18 [Deltaproteobacteria bacterium]